MSQAPLPALEQNTPALPDYSSSNLRLALDLSGGDAACAVADAAGAVRVALRAPLAPDADAPARWLALMELARETLRRCDALPSQVAACALSFPGPVNSQGMVSHDARLPGWSDFDLPRALREHLGIQNARAESRIVCAAWGEVGNGALRPDATFNGRDWLFLLWGATIQVVICANGQLVRGADGAGGALGAICIERGGAMSEGGRRGGLDAYGSMEAFAGRASSYGLSGKSPREVWDLADSNFAAARLRDDVLAAWAQGLGATLCLLNPRRVVIGGSAARELGEGFIGPLGARLRDFCLPIHARNLQLRGAELGQDAALLGAISLTAQPTVE